MFNNQSGKISLPLDRSGDAADFSILSSLKGARMEHSETLGLSRVETHLGVAEGQLAVDVAQTADELIVVAAMAGTPPENIELHLHNDLLTIRGERKSPISAAAESRTISSVEDLCDVEHFYQECYWGKFSRSIVLPADVKAELARAEYNNGVLIIYLPKAGQNSDIPIMVIEE